MLQELLEVMKEGGMQTTESLARRLGVTLSLVEMMLADLEQRGYVKQVGTCEEQCSACKLAVGCEQRTVQKVWAVR